MDLYHGSMLQGLTILKPFISSHTKMYVYASDNKIFATISIGKKPYKNDGFLSYGFYNDEIYLQELQPNVLINGFKNVNGSLYIVDNKTFEPLELYNENCCVGHEFVSGKNVKVKYEIPIENTLEKLLEYEENKELKIIRYGEKGIF